MTRRRADASEGPAKKLLAERVALPRRMRTIWIADAPRDNGKRFVVRADEKLAAFVELESATRK
jgi:hypothetical protein